MSVCLSHSHSEGQTISRDSCHAVIPAPYPPVEAPSEAHQSFQDQGNACEGELKGYFFFLSVLVFSPRSADSMDGLLGDTAEPDSKKRNWRVSRQGAPG